MNIRPVKVQDKLGYAHFLSLVCAVVFAIFQSIFYFTSKIFASVSDVTDSGSLHHSAIQLIYNKNVTCLACDTVKFTGQIEHFHSTNILHARHVCHVHLAFDSLLI